MTKVIHDCRSNNIEVGTFTDTKDGINFWKEKGLSLVEYGSDLNLLIDKLPSDQREVLKMRYYEELSFKKIAE